MIQKFCESPALIHAYNMHAQQFFLKTVPEQVAEISKLELITSVLRDASKLREKTENCSLSEPYIIKAVTFVIYADCEIVKCHKVMHD